MNSLDTFLLGLTLFAMSLAAVGSYAYRSRSQPPYWFWAWAVLLLAGASSEAVSAYPDLGFAPPLLSPVFSALLLAGGLFYAGRPVPLSLVPIGVGLGLARALADAVGQPQVSGVISLAFEPSAAAYTGYLVHRAARDANASWPDRLMPVFLVALAVVEVLGALRPLSGFERIVLWPLWLGAGLPLLALQMFATLEDADRALGRSAEEQRKREETHERFLLLTSRMREIISEISPEGQLRWVSDSVREELGFSPADLIGRAAAELSREFEIERASDGRDELGQDASSDGVSAQVHSLRDGYGRKRWLETQLTRTDGGEILAISRDVTERISVQRELQASEERFRKFSLLGSDYCYVASGSITRGIENWATGALEEISGYSHDELDEIGFEGFIHPDDLSESRSRVLDLFRSRGGESSHEFRLVTKARETRWIAEKILVEREGDDFRIYGAARDITEQRLGEQALAQAQKLESLGLLAGGVAHDFNNLLMVIMGHAEMASELAGADGEMSADLASILDAADQASALTRQLLAYAGRGSVERTPVDLTERVRSVSSLLASAGSNDIDLQLDLASDLARVIADPGEIQQLTMNLVLNAIDACDRDGRVLVSTRRASPSDLENASWTIGELVPPTDYVVLEVSDTGVGMNPTTQQRVFDPFFTTKTTGRGLGLAAVSGIVRSIGGVLRVVSQLGKGTTFTILLPVSDRTIRRVSDSAASAAATGRVLVIDDDELVLGVARRMLVAGGFEVESAADGASGVESFRSKPFDVVVLDAVMPGMSGAETFDEIRRIRPDARVLMASGYDRERAVGDLLDRGLAGFIPKPFRRRELVERISSLLEAPAR